MNKSDFQKECRKAFLRYGASMPLPRPNCDCGLKGIPPRFHISPETPPSRSGSYAET